jgi:hypothetical protein
VNGSTHGSQPGRRRRRWFAAVLLALVAATAAYAAIPRRADLTSFDPQAMARLETSMWRHYYEQRYAALFLDLYQMARSEQGFSPLDSLRIAVAAARAAKAFQPSRSRSEAEAAIPYLVGYFRLLASAAPVPVEIGEAARTELAWWQARREAVTAEQYGAIIARVTTLIYGVDGDTVRRGGLMRARAMAYRDARNGVMTEADWSAIEDQLRLAYGLLQKALSSPPRQH